VEQNRADKTVARLLIQEQACDQETAALQERLAAAHDQAARTRVRCRKRCDARPGDGRAQTDYALATATVGRLAVALGNCQALRLEDDDVHK
jgi:hypothetical protein